MFRKSTGQAAELTSRRRTLISLCVILSCVGSTLMTTALTTAFPALVAEFGVSLSTAQWLTSAYQLVMGTVMPLSAYLITRFPTRRVYLGAMLLFLGGVLLGAAAADFSAMLVGRILQAGGSGLLTAMAQVVLLSIYPVERKGTIMGWFGLATSLPPIVGPTLTGIVVDTVGWRVIFVAVLVLMAAVFILAFAVFGNVLETTARKFDVCSFVQSLLAFGGITLGVGSISSYGLTAPLTLVVLPVGIIAMVLFVHRQLRMTKPFLELRTFQNRDFRLAVVGSALLFLIFMAGSTMVPLCIQSVCGRSATVSGLTCLPGAVCLAVVSPLAGRLYDKMGICRLFRMSAICLLISCSGMAMMNASSPLWAIGIFHALRTIANGCLLMPLVTWGVSVLPGHLTADGSALLTSLRTIAGAIGTAVFVGIMDSAAALPGVDAAAQGMRTAFLGMAVCAIVLVVVSFVFIRNPRGCTQK